LDEGGTAREQITLPDGSLATAQVPLDGEGAVLDPGGTPFYHDYLIYPEKDFGVFNFPAAWG
jgi:hypothetical protein